MRCEEMSQASRESYATGVVKIFGARMVEQHIRVKTDLSPFALVRLPHSLFGYIFYQA
ncbi:hypothetical protein Pan54_30600 [Rubinisphaera italica]|uniref:Uncharacterized protein n=1 Tax=Rubinisphaera italica TaxID=2527969 RepID=A0A5C5XHX2_9PLAN|nr:hypothetical protein Pan54_30600 [Rubinisphaera italica]